MNIPEVQHKRTMLIKERQLLKAKWKLKAED